MTKLNVSYALLALEANGYEQAQGKPYSFLKTIASIPFSVKVTEEPDEPVRGSFTVRFEYYGLSFESRFSVPLSSEGDVKRAEELIFNDLKRKVQYSRDAAKAAWLTQDALHINALALMAVYGPKK